MTWQYLLFLGVMLTISSWEQEVLNDFSQE
jgi:hypothetical protein